MFMDKSLHISCLECPIALMRLLLTGDDLPPIKCTMLQGTFIRAKKKPQQEVKRRNKTIK